MRMAALERFNRLGIAFALFAALAAMLSGCAGGSLSGVFSGSGGGSGKMPPIAFAPIIGPPAEVGSQLTTQLVSAAQQKKIPVVTEKGKPSAYTIQGYLAQSNERNSEKFSYILDVTDKSGNRVHRVLGEETVPAKPGAKPWASINQGALQKIADKTATDLAAWLPSQGGAARPASAPAATSATQKPTAVSSSTQTASSRDHSEPIVALVPPVSGAPGDGRTSLTKALRERLSARGVQIASTGGTNVYRINGKVSVTPASGGNERITINWKLLSPSGQDLGSVTQQSEVPKGSLDRSWGPAATAAGNAAAKEIVNLLKKNRG